MWVEHPISKKKWSLPFIYSLVMTINKIVKFILSLSSSSVVLAFFVITSAFFIIASLCVWIIVVLMRIYFIGILVTAFSLISCPFPFTFIFFISLCLHCYSCLAFFISFLICSLLMRIKGSIKLIFSHAWNISWFFYSHNYVIKSPWQRPYNISNHTLIWNLLIISFIWFDNFQVLANKSMMFQTL